MKETPNPRTEWITVCICISSVAIIALIGFGIFELRSSHELLSAWGEYITGLATLALVLSALLAARTAIFELRGKRDLERAKWLSDLYKDFFQQSQFKEVRSMIDYSNLDTIRTLMTKDLQARKDRTPSTLNEHEKKFLDSFTDFFNFFEMMGYLCKLKIITREDVDAMFGYYLKQLQEVDAGFVIRGYLAQSDFEHLCELGISLEQEKTAKR